jgi:CheY-like chemotaxis protein
MPATITPPIPKHRDQGLTVLAVEDSRLACEALRILAMRAGFRLRRAATLTQAHRHLNTWRPDVLLVDLGLPDGRGEDLIRAVNANPDRPRLILAMSGDPEGRARAAGAGADGFIDKSTATFPALLTLLPCAGLRSGQPLPAPDPLALRDDLAYAADLLSQRQDSPDVYLTGFLAGIAQASGDAALACAARKGNTTALQALVTARLAAAQPF